MSADQTQTLSTCGCCEPEGSPTPEPVQNRPGLSSIQYRMGTYASFLLAMMEEIAGTPELRNRLLTRSTDDFAIALLAMWSYIGDILTFYQERIANEAYLRTALLQESVVQLAALLDYKPAPGAAAETDLAFFLDKNKQVQIPVGFRVQSVPGQNEKPQKFETLAAIIAYAALNQVQIFPQPQIYAPFAQQNAQAILLSDPKGLAPRTKLALFNALRAELKELSSLGLHNTQQVLTWKPAVQSADFQAFTTQVTVYNSEFRLFGYNAPSSYVKTKPDPSAPGKVSFELLTAPYTTDSTLPPPPSNEIALDARYNNLKAGGTVLIAQTGPATDPSLSFARLAKIANVSAQPAHYGPLDGTVTWLTLGFGIVGKPVVALDSSGQLNAFVIGDDGALWTIRQQVSGGWDDWQSLGGNVDLLAVGTNQDGRLEIFARGTKDKALWHIWQTSPSGGWSWWDSRGGRIDLLAVSRNQDGRLEVFARGLDDKALWHIWQTAPNNGWSGWGSLGGEIDLLDVGMNKDGRLEVFARGMDQALWHIWQTAPNNGWSGWASLGGIIDLLTVGSNQDGRLEVFARGMDKALWHIWQTAPNNGWSGWASEGGVIEQLTVGSNQDGRLEVFVGGADQALWHNWQTAPNNGWSGWASLDVPMWPITDEGRGRITVYEVVQMLEFSQFRYGDSISGGTVYVPVANLPGIDKKRSIILDDAAADPETVVVQSAQQVDTDGDGQADHWLIAFTPDLTRTLTTASATMFGNVCTSSHGQTIAGEVLGNGDASQTFQSFRLQKSPVTFVHQAGAPHGVADSLQIQLAGVLWKETQDFFGHSSTERIFVTSQDAQGMTVQFGDGVTGSRLPTGRGNVVATYRQGIGTVGNVSAGALRTLLDRPVGLKSVSNPGPATGGADAETLDQTRGNAPNTVRTFGRIVSLEDFEDAAREVAGIAKAHAYSGWTGEEQVVYLTVSGIEGAAVIGNLYSDLVADLNSRRDPNRTMIVQSYTKIPVRLAATIFVSADHVADDVLAAVQAAVTRYFAFDNQQFGQPVHLSNVYAVIQGIGGVTGADISTLQYKKASDAMSHGATSDAVQLHLRIDSDELAELEDLIDDAAITVGAPV